MRYYVLITLLLLSLGWVLVPRLIAQAPTVAQAESTQPGIPPANVPPSEVLSWQLAAAYVADRLIKKLKTWQGIPFIKDGAGWINVAVSGFLALAVSLGIHTEFDPSAGTLLITGLTLASLTHAVGEWLRQWAFQQLVHHTSAY